MTRTRKICMAAFAALCAVCLGFALAGCGSKETAPTYGYGEEGTYYYSASEDTDFLLTMGGGTYILEMGTSGYTGTYEWTEGTATFYEGEEETVTGTMTDSGISLTREGRTYLFLRYEYYTVSFMDGGTTLSTQSVLNGKAATDPGDAEKEGYVFLGWYADSSYTTRYEFNTSITGNTTVYARFVEVTGVTEYRVTYDFGNGETYTTETLNGKIYDLPEAEMTGYTFLGWWVSATNSADELTYRYTDETLYEDTTLFAFWAQGSSYIGASVKDDGIYWENYNASVTEIILRAEDGSEVERFSIQSTSGSYSYDFASLPAGKYTLVIQGGGIDETLTYVSNGLSRVSGFTVVSGSILMHSAVDNAERYYISIDCGNPSHDHTYIDNGTSLYYDFSSCDMPATGITFTVYAYAEGYYYSVSSYNYFLGLENTEVTVSGDAISWERVENALEYEVYIGGELVATTSNTSWSLSGYGTGTYEIAVRPVTTGYYSELSETVTFTKTTLAAPKVTGIENYVVSWTEVEGATGYKINIGGVETTVEEGITSLYLTEDNYTEGLDSYEISVKALAPDSANDSPYGETITVTGTSVGSAVSYNNGTVTWQYSLSASEYRITVNDGDETVVFGRNSSPITLTRSGNNEIAIYFVDADDNVYGTASVNVYAYAIVFDARGGTAYMDGEVVDTIYVAKGDTVTLPEADYGTATADFAGWYSLPDMTADPDAVDYMGDGVKYGDEGDIFVFTGNSTIVLYACWLNPRMLVSLDPGMGTLTDGDGNLITETEISLNGRNYTVAVPDISDKAYVFYGWYSGPDGAGTRYTDEYGDAYAPFSDETVTTLYACWIQVLEITSAGYNTSSEEDNVFSVSKGPDIGLVSEVTVPESYTVDGVEYTQGIIIGTAFSSLDSLKTINIPDTIVYIQMSGNGYDSGSGVFASTALEAVNVYATGEPSTTKEITYYSDDGVLFRKTDFGDAELYFYPHGKTAETYVIPETVWNDNELGFSGRAEVPVVRSVTAIGNNVFDEHSELTYMVIPEYIATIGIGTFYNCRSLTGVEFECELKEITDDMFRGCSSLVGFDIPDTVKEIGGNAFRSSGLRSITIPETVETMGTYVFAYCYDLENAYLPSSLTKIGGYTFYYCTALRAIEVPHGVETIDNYAFYDCESLVYVSLPDSLTTMGNSVFRSCKALPEIVLPDSLTSMGTYCFDSCYSLRSVHISEGLTEIPDYTFRYCYSLKSVVIPAGIVSIGTQAFYECYKLVEVFNLSSSFTVTAGSTGNGYVGAYAVSVLTSLDGGSQIATEGDYSFVLSDGVYYLFDYIGTDTDIVLPADIYGNTYEIYKYAFYENDTLTSVTMTGGVTAVGQYAFTDCTSVSALTLTEGLKSIGSYAFQGCVGIMTVTIPSTVTSIGTDAFLSCYKLVEVCDLSSLGIVAGDTGNGYVGYYALHVYSDASEGSHIVKDGDFSFVYDDEGNYYMISYTGSDNEITLPETVAGKSYGIYDYAFYGYSSLKAVKTPSGLTSVGDYAFYECELLEEINIPSGVSSIGAYSFYGCESLRNADIPSSVTEIGEYAFYGCSSIKNVDIPDSVTTMGKYAFRGCTSIESVTLGSGLEIIPTYAFYGCSSLKAIVIPDAITTIDERAFYNCTSLKSISIGNGVTEIGKLAFTNTGCYNDSSNWEGGILYIDDFVIESDSVSGDVKIRNGARGIADQAFYSNSYITSVTISNSVAFIGSYAFYANKGLTSVVIPDSVLYMSDRVFYNCTALESVILGNGLTEIGEYDFYGCPLNAITIPDSVKVIRDRAFYNCSSLVSITFGSGLEVIEEYVFYGCKLLESVALPESCVYVGDYAFYNCSALVSCTMGSNVTYVGTRAFYGCSSLKDIVIPDSVTYLGSYAFYNCTSLETAYIGSGVTTIEAYLFRGCSSLKSVVIAGTITEIGNYAFYNCSKLTQLYYGGDAESWNAKNVGTNNSPLTSSSLTIYYYSETQPAESGNWWHFDKDGNAVAW